MPHRAKVVHLVEDLKVGGLEKVIAGIVTGLNHRKFDVEIWCLANGGQVADWLRQMGMAVQIFNWRTYHNPLNIARLSYRLRKSKVDIVHTHGYFGSTFGRIAALAAGVRRILTHVHTSYSDFSRRNLLVEKGLSYATPKIICVSKTVRDFVERREGVRPEKTCLIYNVPVWLFENGSDRPPSRPRLGFSGQDCVIVSVGSLVENKGHRVLIEALRMLIPTHPHLKLLILGDGPLRPDLEQLVQRHQLASAVVFAGVVKSPRLFLALSDIFVLPTLHREGLPLAVLEAMDQGLPVVASRIGGIPEAVAHNRSGLLVPPKDCPALGAAIARLATDSAERNAMGVEGQKIVSQKFRHDRMIAQIEALYETLLDGRGGVSA
jgi:glycosyltransferase involved in cell wall biosynthesis